MLSEEDDERYTKSMTLDGLTLKTYRHFSQKKILKCFDDDEEGKTSDGLYLESIIRKWTEKHAQS